MASYRKPKGIAIRAVPDWNQQFLGTAPAQTQIDAGTPYAAMGVFNNDTLGRDYVIWSYHAGAIQVNTAAPGQLIVETGFEHGLRGSVGTDVTSFINPLQSARSGVEWIDFTATGLLAPNVLDFPLAGAGHATWDLPWPCAILPPGWSFFTQFFLQPVISAIMAVTWNCWFEMAGAT